MWCGGVGGVETRCGVQVMCGGDTYVVWRRRGGGGGGGPCGVCVCVVHASTPPASGCVWCCVVHMCIVKGQVCLRVCYVAQQHMWCAAAGGAAIPAAAPQHSR